MRMPPPVVKTDLTGLRLLNRGKVRDMYAVGDDLLIVTTDRISAFDSILASGVPWKGKVLTALTVFWLDYLGEIVPNHLITADVDQMPEAVAGHEVVLRDRSMLVRRADVLPVECVVRGYLSGSGWSSYQKDRTVCGIELPEGLQESSRLPEPVFTPTTKADEGHDEPIDFARMCKLLGEEVARQMRELSLRLYNTAADYARSKGIIIADTKFEWGLCAGQVTLIDEVLTPDSSRFWPADLYEPGHSQPSYDKQYVRDWLDESGWDHEPPAPALPQSVAEKTAEKYLEVCRVLTGSSPAD
jgi:phosphoribosylaminoimidazole-succinocarboxamide synthase